jgi:hypothetical protein
VSAPNLAGLVGRNVRIHRPGVCSASGTVTAIDLPIEWSISTRTPDGVRDDGKAVGRLVTFDSGRCAVVFAESTIEVLPEEAQAVAR